MNQFKEYLDQLLSSQESSELEFKHAHGGFPGTFWDTYSAFANTNGGMIIFGVKEKHNVFSLDPIDSTLAEKLIKTFWKQVRSKDSINICLLSNDDIKIEKYNDNNIIIFNIPRAPVTDRPVYIGRDPLTGTFRRGHEGDYRCTPSEVRQMFADANNDVPADSRLLENFGMDDIDLETINQYRQRMAVANPDHVWLGLDNKQLLQKLGGYRIDRRTKKEGLTVAGLLMFGKWSSIRDVDGMPNYGVDYREYTETSERWSHRIFSDGSWESNLFQFFYRVLPRLQNVIDTPFRLEGSTRIDQKPAHKSIREALVNCIIHAAYN
ncbi:MAG: putative DNA binding domain-containing protein [Paramuribaculum sp.]|nr:putative DNA binding domain-containing protein [Paramuribaculum sp.]